MKTKYIASILTLLLFASVFTFGLAIKKTSADGTTLSIPSVSKNPSDLGTSFTVPVQISDVNDLYGFDIKITWDNTLITFASLSSNAAALWTGGYFEPLPVPGYQTGAGYVRYSAVATGGQGYTNVGPTTLFTITFTIAKAGNFPYATSLHFETIKLSDHNANTITATTTDGSYSMSATTPDLEFEYYDPTPSKPAIEYGKTFEINVYVTDVTDLKDYNLVIVYDSSLLKLTSVDWTSGVLGGTSDQASYTESPPGTINVVDTGGITWTGTKGLLFTLSFQVYFNDNIEHIWRTNNQGPLHAIINFSDATLSSVDGSITKSGISMPQNQDIVVNLIQGDVDCNGKVTVFDLRTVAGGYDKTSSDSEWTAGHYWSKYDLKADGTIDVYDLVKVATNFNYNNP